MSVTNTTEFTKQSNEYIAVSLNVDSIEFDHMYTLTHTYEPHLITPRLQDGVVIGEDEHYCIRVDWWIDGTRFFGLIPINTYQRTRKLEIIPFLWTIKQEWSELDGNEMFNSLRRMVEESRNGNATLL